MVAKRRKEARKKAKAERVITHQSGGQADKEEQDSDWSEKSPSLEIEEEDDQIEKGRAYLETTPFCTKRTRDPEEVGSWKNPRLERCL